jgi:hypothetical protein
MNQCLDRRDSGLLAAGELAVAETFKSMADQSVALTYRQSPDRSHQPLEPLALLDRLRRRRSARDGVVCLQRHSRPRCTGGVDHRVVPENR